MPALGDIPGQTAIKNPATGKYVINDNPTRNAYYGYVPPAPPPAPVNMTGVRAANNITYTPYKAPPPPVVQTYDPMKDPTYLSSMSRLNDLWSQANGYKGQIDTAMKTGFSYDPTKDASYQSLQTLAQNNAKTASAAAMEALNDRGILNSTITGDRIGQIEQTAQDAVTAQVPALQNAAYGKYMDNLNQLNNLYNSLVGQAQNERAFGEDKRRWELGYNMDQQKMNTANYQWKTQFDYNSAQDAINNTFKQDQMQLDYNNYDLAKLKDIQSSTGYVNDQSTQQALAELMTYNTPEDMRAALQAKAGEYANKGADINQIITAIDRVYPGFASSVKGDSPVNYNK